MRAWVYSLLGICVLGIGTMGYVLYSTGPQTQPLTEDERAAFYTTNAPITTQTSLRPVAQQPSGLEIVTNRWDSLVHTYAGETPEPKAPTRAPRPSTVLPQYGSPTLHEDTGYEPTSNYTPPTLTLPTGQADDVLHSYGNTVGSTIQSAVSAMGDQNVLLMAFVKDPSQKEPVLDLAATYDALAVRIDRMQHPKGFGAAAHDLAQGYTNVADGLRTLANAEPDDVYDKLLAYNAQIEHFADAFVAYASLFGAHGVTFSSTEPGGIFTPITTSL